MTCQKLHSYFADPLRVDADLRANCAEVAEHIVGCADCNRFVEAQRELGTSLRLARMSAPQLSASLDAAVLANYRRHIATLESSVSSTPVRRRRSLSALGWSTAVAAALLVTAIAFFSSRKTVTTGAPLRTAQRADMPQPPESNHRGTVVAPRTRRTKPDVVLARRKPPAISPASAGSSLPAGFRSLMYCDELSCVGAMEMIRVQLPSSVAAGLTSASTPTNGVVFADVLVGPDGIARSIRIED